MESKLDFKKIGVKCSAMMFNEFSFRGMCNELASNGGDVFGLNVNDEGERIYEEHIFREFLIAVISIPLDLSRLTIQDKASINEVMLYLSTKVEY